MSVFGKPERENCKRYNWEVWAIKELIVGGNDAGRRLDRFLGQVLPDLPRSLLYKAIREKKIKLDGKRAAPDAKLTAGGVIAIYLPDRFLSPGGSGAEPFRRIVTPRVSVVYEDEHILIADKPAGQSVHEDEHGSADTLIAHIQAYLWQKGAWSPEEEHHFAPALAHRIDRNTSGLVMAAKNAEALRILTYMIRHREITKEYRCAVLGTLSPPAGTLTHHLRRDDKRVWVEKSPFPGGQKAVLRYQTLATGCGLSLLRVELVTGRTHQIRAQMAFVGHPLWGDGKYGRPGLPEGLPRRGGQALQAWRVTFDFGEDAGVLDYLRGQSFTAPRAEWESVFE